MFERFTAAARRTVQTALLESSAAEATECGPDHLLSAMLDEPRCTAMQVLEALAIPAQDVRDELARVQRPGGFDRQDAEALAALGIDLDEVLARVERNLGGLQRARSRPRLSREAKKVLELALREAVALHHRWIGTEHLLLALVRADQEVLLRVLEQHEVSRTELRREVADRTRRAG